MLEIVCVPVIVSICYGVMEIYKKYIAKEKELLVSIIPIISGILGGILGVIAFYVCPSIIVATNVGVALLVGICSGLSATGTNQIFKQFKKLGVNVKETKSDGDSNDKSN